MNRFRTGLAALFGGLVFAASASPAQALERLVLRMPFLETSIRINFGDARSVEDLIRASPDLAELQSASDGQLPGLLRKLFLTPLPEQTEAFLKGASGQPLLEQALAAATYFVDLQGVEIDTSGELLTNALSRAISSGQPNILGFLRELPGEEASLDLSRVTKSANRLKGNLEEGVALVKAVTPATVDPSLRKPLSRRWRREIVELSVSHRPDPLRLISLLPADANGRLVVVSHGLWDEPESFEGWGEVLAEHGYTVLLPDHPGSNYRQQKLMLAGDRPPPGPEELRLRPLDVSAAIDAVQDARLLSGRSLNTDSVGVVGHSWGATTTLQLAGAIPTDRKLNNRCGDLQDPERNISWVLQCSWLSGIQTAGLADPRVNAVVAVSPPLRLLFEPSSKSGLNAKVLLVSGSRDWVVPSGPEAIRPMRESGAVELGHRLVLVGGADHFNMSSLRGEAQPALVGPVILAWFNEQLQVPRSPIFSKGGWGDQQVQLVDVSERL